MDLFVDVLLELRESFCFLLFELVLFHFAAYKRLAPKQVLVYN